MIADGSYSENKEDPLVRVIGPEHGGRTRTLSQIIGYTKVHGGLFKNVNHDKVLVPQVEARLGIRVDYPPIKNHTSCELLLKVGDSLEKVADGMAWPSTDTILHCKTMAEGCVKVTVDDVVDEFKMLKVYKVTMTSELRRVEEMVDQIVQWPRHAIRLANQGAPSTPSTPRVDDDDTSDTSSYRPQKVDEVQCGSLEFHDEHMTCYQLVDEDDQNQTENLDTFKDGFLNALLSMEQKQIAESATVWAPELEPEPEPEPQITIINDLENDTLEDPDLEPILEKLKKRAGIIRVMFDNLHKLVGTRHSICISSPQGMYPERVANAIPYSELLGIFSKEWLDFSIIHSFTMCFFLSPKSECAFLDPNRIKGTECDTNSKAVVEHIKEIFKYHGNKRFFLAPFVSSGHWTLFIFEPSTSTAYIVDSLKWGKSEKSYTISGLANNGFGRKFTWTVVNCNQQKEGWECGYMVIKHMREFVETIQYNFVEKLWNKQGITSHKEIDFMVVDLMDHWINKVFGV